MLGTITSVKKKAKISPKIIDPYFAQLYFTGLDSSYLANCNCTRNIMLLEASGSSRSFSVIYGCIISGLDRLNGYGVVLPTGKNNH